MSILAGLLSDNAQPSRTIGRVADIVIGCDRLLRPEGIGKIASSDASSSFSSLVLESFQRFHTPDFALLSEALTLLTALWQADSWLPR